MSPASGAESLPGIAPSAAPALVARAADDWGGRFSARSGGGRLDLPVVAGLRHGRLGLGLRFEDDGGGGTRIRWEIEEERWEVQGTVVVVLVLAGLGSSMAIVAPFVPRLLPLVPLGIMLGVGAWFFVVAGLRNAGTEEFFEQLGQPADSSGGDDGAGMDRDGRTL